MRKIKSCACTLIALTPLLCFCEQSDQAHAQGDPAPVSKQTIDNEVADFDVNWDKETQEEEGKKSILCFLSIEDAIRETIQYQWAIATSAYNIQEQLGLYQQAVGVFDPQISTSITDLEQIDLQGPLGMRSDLRGRVTTTTFGVAQLLPSGASYDLSYVNTNTINEFTIPCDPPRLDKTVITFALSQPLLRNLWYSPQTTLARTQWLQYEAARLTNIQNIATAIAATLSAYWNTVGTKLIYEEFATLVKKLGKFAEITEDLVENDQAGKASLQQPYANLANAQVQMIQAKQNWVAAYNQLAFLMGRPAINNNEQIICDIELEDFPSTEDIKKMDKWCYSSLLQQIEVKRADVAAFLLQEDIAYWNLKSAYNALLPQLDINASLALKSTNACAFGNGSGIYESFPIDRPEKDYMVGLALSFPFCNTVAKGLVRQQKAALIQAEVNTDQLVAQLVTQYNTAFSFNNALIEEMVSAHEASKEFELATYTVLAKLQEGLSTYFELLTLANDTASAKVQEINIKILYFQNLVELYLLTGNMVWWDKCGPFVDVVDARKQICKSLCTKSENDESQNGE
jgi:outer membrane protein TolC